MVASIGISTSVYRGTDSDLGDGRVERRVSEKHGVPTTMFRHCAGNENFTYI
jgi:hypothetical protein